MQEIMEAQETACSHISTHCPPCLYLLLPHLHAPTQAMHNSQHVVTPRSRSFSLSPQTYCPCPCLTQPSRYLTLSPHPHHCNQTQHQTPVQPHASPSPSASERWFPASHKAVFLLDTGHVCVCMCMHVCVRACMCMCVRMCECVMWKSKDLPSSHGSWARTHTITLSYKRFSSWIIPPAPEVAF